MFYAAIVAFILSIVLAGLSFRLKSKKLNTISKVIFVLPVLAVTFFVIWVVLAFLALRD